MSIIYLIHILYLPFTNLWVLIHGDRIYMDSERPSVTIHRVLHPFSKILLDLLGLPLNLRKLSFSHRLSYFIDYLNFV